MGTEEDLHMMQLADSMFPSGLFAASGGIETMYREGRITGAAELRGYLRAAISHQLGPFDCVMLARAHGSPGIGGVLEADSACHAMRSNAEARTASCRSGGQLAACVAGFSQDAVLEGYRSAVGSGGASGEYPVSFGVCCRAVGMEARRSAATFLYGAVAGSVGAALRLGMIDHLEGQNTIHALKPDISRAAHDALYMEAREAWQFAPQAEIYQMAHEGADSNMFVT